MIHLLQVLCGPARHAILGIMYDTATISPEDAMDGLKALVEMQVDHGIINKRCEICDKKIVEFTFEDGVSKEQNWDRALDKAKQLEVEQGLAQRLVKAQRKAAKN